MLWPTVSEVPVADNVTLATDAGGGVGEVTVNARLPLLPSDVAVTVAVPAPTAVTVPLGAVVITARLLLVQEIVRPESVLPWASLSTTATGWDWPTSMLVDVALTVTLATGAGAGG